MEHPVMSFSAVYLKVQHGFVGFLEELPGVNAQGRTIDEARANLRRLAAVVFEEERARSAELLAGKDVVREEFRAEMPAMERYEPEVLLAGWVDLPPDLAPPR